MNLAQAESRMLFLQFVSAPAVSQMLPDQLNHFDISALDPGQTAFVPDNVMNYFSIRHHRQNRAGQSPETPFDDLDGHSFGRGNFRLTGR